MRRLSVLLITLFSILALCIWAGAVTQTSQMNVHTAVSADGSCQVAVSATVHLDESKDSLLFPLPDDADRISLNGSWTRTRNVNGMRCIDLSRAMGGFAGDFSFTVNYNLPNRVVKNDVELLELRLPIMSGFSYPTQTLEFTVTLPGNITTKPGFTSGYHQANIEQDLSYTIDGAVITGRSQKTLKDHETLEMILPVTEEMFPQTTVIAPNLEEVNIATMVIAALAALYWIIFLRCFPWLGRSQSSPPEGYSAGEIHAVLNLQGTDLTLMIFTWAQLGYVIIEKSRNGKVLLHKQMEMGNERSSLERRAFKSLFGARQVIDTSGLRYSELWQKIHKLPPDIGSLVQKHSGNLKVFRFLCALAGLCCGVSLGIVISAGAVLQWPLAVLLAVVGFAASYLMQPWVSALFSMNRSRLWIMLSLAALWIVSGIVLKQPSLGIAGAASGFVGGIFLFCAGRRTDAGYQALLQVIGLYRYFLTVPAKELQEIFQANPEYFFDLAPYAMALGADRTFANRFGKLRLPDCPYIRADRTENLTALQWSNQMRAITKAMDDRRKHTFMERFLRIFSGFVR